MALQRVVPERRLMLMNRPVLHLWFGLMVVTLLTACVAPAAGNLVRSEKKRLTSDATESELESLVAGNTAFAFDLYRVLCKENDGNLLFSPFSLSSVLAMTYAGAEGETEQQMGETLHIELPQDRFHRAFNALDSLITEQAKKEDGGLQLEIANALWGQQEFSFLPEFLDLLAQEYGAGLRTLDFATDPEAARKTINDWVADQTQDRIKDLIPRGMLDELVRLVLTNAIYFNGKWVHPFAKNATDDAIFTLLDSSTVTVLMMHETAVLRYAQGNNYRAVELPYRDSEMAMLIILPDLGSHEEIEEQLSYDLLHAIAERLHPQTLRLGLPKFTFDSQFSLSHALSELGMGTAFSPATADFRGMTGHHDLVISDVLHKAFVEVDEAGTEAAAASAVVMRLSSAVADEPVDLLIDHPFIFVIRDNDTGTILFVGRVTNPLEE
jgi:serpin B